MIFLIIILIALFIWAFWHGLITRRYIICSDKIKKRIKIVLVSDTHSHIFGRNQRHISAKIKKAGPDIILLAGDIYDLMEATPAKGAEQLFEAVKNIAPVYYVTGNHDMVKSRSYPELKASIAARGITVLDNKYIKLNINGNPVIIGGVDDPGTNRKGDSPEYKRVLENKWRENAGSYFQGLENDGSYKILLSHRPEKTDIYARLPFDLILSGHAHGGQWRVPALLNGLYSPDQGLFPKYPGGKYVRNGMPMIVSRGLAKESTRVPKIYNRPELVVVDLAPAGVP